MRTVLCRPKVRVYIECTTSKPAEERTKRLCSPRSTGEAKMAYTSKAIQPIFEFTPASVLCHIPQGQQDTLAKMQEVQQDKLAHQSASLFTNLGGLPVDQELFLTKRLLVQEGQHNQGGNTTAHALSYHHLSMCTNPHHAYRPSRSSSQHPQQIRSNYKLTKSRTPWNMAKAVGKQPHRTASPSLPYTSPSPHHGCMCRLLGLLGFVHALVLQTLVVVVHSNGQHLQSHPMSTPHISTATRHAATTS